MDRRLRWRRAALALVLGAFVVALGPPAAAQSRAEEEARREKRQRVDDIFAAMQVRFGAVVADVGAGSGFFTARLSKAVGADGKVYAVDISARALRRLADRVKQDGLVNVVIVEGETHDPKLPAGALDAALIVNAYHEMREYRAMLAALRAALKPTGRLVIVDQIGPDLRTAPRDEQTREHELSPDLIQQDLREAGFKVVKLEDPFIERRRDVEFLVAAEPDVPPGYVPGSRR